MTKDELQEAAARILLRDNRLICQWATGAGKTNVALKFINANPWLNTLIFVPEHDNISNWEMEFKKFNVPMDNVTIACYASMHKYIDTKWDFVVFDEAPHVDTPLKSSICQTIKAEWVLALGAKVTINEIDTLESVYGPFRKSYISLDKAVEMNLLPEPMVKVYHLQMDDTKLDKWYRGKVYTAKGLYNLLCEKVELAVTAHNNRPTPYSERNMFNAGLERKRFLGELKQDAIKKICEMLDEEGKRYLCFCSSIKQAQLLGGDKAYTSKSAKSEKHLEKFNNHEINSLFVVGKLIEGQTLNDIECGVIGQIGGTERITVQSIGRILRAKNPVIYIPVFDGTKDKSYLYTLTNNISKNYIEHCKF